MNNGKICVSVCAETANEFIDKMKRAAEITDVIELRFDCLNSDEISKTFGMIKAIRKRFDGKLLATYRPQEQGGKRDLTPKQREEFWLDSHVFEFVNWADIEEDLPVSKITKMFGSVFNKVIKSYHNFTADTDDLSAVFDRLSNQSEIIKIAIQTNKISDSTRVWSLLKKVENTSKSVIPIAMGEAGKWTRILGLAHGAPLTYASLKDGNETAPGQISTKDLIDVYRVKELDKQTEVYGVIGNPVSHSLSPYIHNEAFKNTKVNATYIPLEVNDLEEFLKVMVQPETRKVELNIRGFSVTIPHKETIVPHLDFIDPVARVIGAVNTVKIADGKLHGYNTDAAGFISPLRKIFPDLRDANVAIIGGGGVARAAIHSLQMESADITVYLRNPSKYKKLAGQFNVTLKPQNDFEANSHDIVINCTPLGLKGELENESPLYAEQLKNIQLAYDLVYNPMSTRFLREAEMAGAKTLSGLEMFLSQAIEQQKIWTQESFDPSDFRSTVTSRLTS